MKHFKYLYWLITGSMAAFMLLASAPDILRIPEAVAIFGHLGYPRYLLPFLGVAKTLGVLAVIAPRLRTLKEWAYAGLVFDLTGAFYSHLSVGDPASVLVFPAIGLVLVTASYVVYHWYIDHATTSPGNAPLPFQRPQRAQGASMNPVIRVEREAARVVRWEPSPIHDRRGR
jgi:hypothetical protein